MAATSSNSAEWQTPDWLVEKCREMLGGTISLDAASSAEANKVIKADRFYDITANALAQRWDHDTPYWDFRHSNGKPTLFLNPPGERSGKLIRQFWSHWDHHSASGHFYASVWVDFNLDHLRFIRRVPGDILIIPRKRLAFKDPATGKVKKGAQIGGFLLFRGAWGCSDSSIPRTIQWPDSEYLCMLGQD